MRIIVLPGDGIGPEVVGEALKVLSAFCVSGINIQPAEIGRTAYHNVGCLLPAATIKAVKSCDAVLLGAVGSNVTSDSSSVKPEKALLQLRKLLNCFVNLRFVKHHKSVKLNLGKACRSRADILIVRELNSGAYFGLPRGVRRFHLDTTHQLTEGFCASRYSSLEVESIARIAFEIATKRHKQVLLVDKANVLETSMVWRETVGLVAKDYKNVGLQVSYVDSASLAILRNPECYDVVLTENLFGDILSDHLSLLAGSIGMLPSVSFGLSNIGLYEPVHGSAPTLTGTGLANPIATILALGQMLRYSLRLPKEADAVSQAVAKVLRRGYRTSDISDTKDFVKTSEMGNRIVAFVRTA